LRKPLRGIVDIEAIEQIPLDERLRVVDISTGWHTGWPSRKPDDTAIFYRAGCNVSDPPLNNRFANCNTISIGPAALLRARGIGQTDVVAILLPAVPEVYWSSWSNSPLRLPFRSNWMLEPENLLRLLREQCSKRVIALGPTPGFSIWGVAGANFEGSSPPTCPIFSVAGPQGERLRTPTQFMYSRIVVTGRDVARRPGDAIAVYLHPEGPTGLPKIIKVSHRNASYRHGRFSFAYKATMGEVYFNDSPMFHSGGLIGPAASPVGERRPACLFQVLMGAVTSRICPTTGSLSKSIACHVSPAFQQLSRLEQESASGRESFITQALFHYWFPAYRYRCENRFEKFPEYAY